MLIANVNVTDFRDNLADYLDLVRYKNKSLNITKRGKIVARLSPKEEKVSSYTKELKKAAGTLSAQKYSQWKNIEDIVNWVNKQRKQSERY